MKFEEAIEKIEDEVFQDKWLSADDPWENMEKMKDILLSLKETYAPKIKMTFEQKDELMQFLDESNFGFETFWFCLGSGANLYKEFSENELMQAWLHPELIEVVDD